MKYAQFVLCTFAIIFVVGLVGAWSDHIDDKHRALRLCIASVAAHNGYTSDFDSPTAWKLFHDKCER